MGLHPLLSLCPFACLNQGLSLNLEPTKLKILAGMAGSESPNSCFSTSPGLGLQARTATPSFYTLVLGIQTQFLILGQQIPY